MTHGHCLARLDAYLEGALPERGARRVEHHLACCPECRSVARQRSQVLEAARRVHARPAAPGAVMRRRGVSGRLVVVGLVAVVALAAVLAGLWALGAPEPVAGPADQDPVAAVGQTSERDVDDAARRVQELRESGWAVPSLAGSGMRPLEVEVSRSGAAARVSVTWGRTAPVVTVRECRGDADARDRCAGVQDATDGAQEGSLALGPDYRIEDAGDGWRAWLSTGDTTYRVDARVPRAQAQPLLSQLVVADRSGVAELRHRDAVGDRLWRGLERLLGADPAGARFAPAAAAAA